MNKNLPPCGTPRQPTCLSLPPNDSSSPPPHRAHQSQPATGPPLQPHPTPDHVESRLLSHPSCFGGGACAGSSRRAGARWRRGARPKVSVRASRGPRRDGSRPPVAPTRDALVCVSLAPIRPAGRPPVHPHGWMVTAAGGSGQSQLCLGRRRRSAHRGGRRCEACNAGREVWKGQDEQRARAPSAPPWRCGWLWRSDTPADISLVSAAVPPPPKRHCLEVLTVV